MTEQESSFAPVKAARYLGISEASLRLWRKKDKGPRYFRAGAKLVRYRRSDLDAWIEGQLSTPKAIASANVATVGGAR